MIKKKIYKWHRTCSLIIAIPVLLWAASGLMHPVMTNIRPNIATQYITPTVIDINKIKISLQQTLIKNNIDSFQSFRLVHIDTNWFYQIKTVSSNQLQYLSTETGKKLNKGDWIYAQYLARYFLEGNSEKKKDSFNINPINNKPVSTLDCCDAAAAYVLKPSKGCVVKDISFLSTFDNEYRNINRLLPVYKVSFERKDGIKVYVETAQDRFAFAVDNKRATLNTLFNLIHTWEWINFLGKGKIFVELFFSGLAFITAVMGIYIFFITKSKKINGNSLVKARRNHRYTSIVIVLFTLMFTFSGFYHAFSKFKDDTRDKFFVTNSFLSSSNQLNINKLFTVIHKPVINISLIKMYNAWYWQVTTKSNSNSKDLMKEMSVNKPSVEYLNTTDLSVIPDGDKKYAHYLAEKFSKYTAVEIVSDSLITKFDDEYNFTDKRLPVWKIVYAKNNNERYYVETTTGKLSKQINDNDLYEGYSFALLHKHHFMDFAGKNWRDFSTMFWAAAQIIMVIVGLMLYFKFINKNKKA